MWRRTDRDRGFSLVEIVVAIVLVGILSAIVVVGVGRLTSQGSSAACQASMDAARVASTTHTLTTGAAPVSFNEVVSTGALSLPSGVTVDSGGRRLLGDGWQLVMTSGSSVQLTCSSSTSAFPADAVSSSAAAAFSLRQTSATYAGPAVRVRRSSDNAVLDVGFTAAGDLDAVALLAFVGSGSAFVTTWYDQSGNGRHAVQTSGGAQPQLVNAGVVVSLGGRPVLFFDGNDVMPVGGTSFGTQASPFAAVTTYRRQDPAVGNRSVWGNRGGAEDGGRVLRSTSGAVGYFHTGIVGVGPTSATDNAGVVHSVRVDVELRQRVNGGADTTSPTIAVRSTNGGWAFGVQGATFDPQNMVGNIAEAIFFDGPTTSADIQSLERSQGAYFGIGVP